METDLKLNKTTKTALVSGLEISAVFSHLFHVENTIEIHSNPLGPFTNDPRPELMRVVVRFVKRPCGGNDSWSVRTDALGGPALLLLFADPLGEFAPISHLVILSAGACTGDEGSFPTLQHPVSSDASNSGSPQGRLSAARAVIL